MCEIATSAQARAKQSISTKDVENDEYLLSAEIKEDPSAAIHCPEPHANGDVAFDDVSGESLESTESERYVENKLPTLSR